MANIPQISWYEGENKESSEVSYANFGTVDADDDSIAKTYFIWNNRNGDENLSKMEEVTYTTRDRLGGTEGAEAVRDNWFQVKVDSLNEEEFTAVGKDGVKEVGTNGSTINPNAATASEWATGVQYEEGDYIKPTSDNEYFYRVTVGGTTGGNEPAWTTTEGNVITDGTVEYTAIKISKTPAAQEILGLANNVEADGSNADDAGGNFIKITVYAEVPIQASAGKNLLMQRVKI